MMSFGMWYSRKLTTPTDVKAATMLMSVGIMLNLPAYEEQIIQ